MARIMETKIHGRLREDLYSGSVQSEQYPDFLSDHIGLKDYIPILHIKTANENFVFLGEISYTDSVPF